MAIKVNRQICFLRRTVYRNVVQNIKFVIKYGLLLNFIFKIKVRQGFNDMGEVKI